MRRSLSTIHLLLLLALILLLGLAGCSRSAQVRETDATAGPATEAAEVVSSAAMATPAPGETVVSAVTTAPGVATPATGVQPVASATVEIPAAQEPTATPTPTEVPSSGSSSSASGTTGDTIVHTVKRGESLSLIAERYGTTWRAIAEANDLSDPRTIVAGQKLKIPTSGSGTTSGGTSSSGCSKQHVVKKGEWVWQIARDYGVSPYSILSANDLTIKQARTIHVGQKLCIP